MIMTRPRNASTDWTRVFAAKPALDEMVPLSTTEFKRIRFAYGTTTIGDLANANLRACSSITFTWHVYWPGCRFDSGS